MICKKILLSTFLVLAFCCTPVYSAYTGRLEYNDALFDYSKLDYDGFLKTADLEFEAYKKVTDEKERESLTRAAMSKYYILTRISPEEIYPYVQLARVYMDVEKKRFAREYLSTALNIEHDNPFVNYYYGEYYYKYRDYRRALKHYLIAYNNGYNNLYDINLKMAIIYEKFGDLVKSAELYKKAYSMNTQNADLKEKINSLSGMGYENSEYYDKSILRE